MTKVRWLVSVVGEGVERQAGDITEETEETAVKWADGERAVRVDRQQQPETMTTMRPAENAARRVKGTSG